MRALHTAATGMMAQELNVQVISNNIANMRTTGYKRQRAEFQDLLYEHVRRIGTQTSDQGNILPVGVDLGSGVKTVGTPRIMTQGTLLATGRDLDVAIRGEGFFKIQMPDGTYAYTRDGSFEMDDQGRLVTAGGNLVQPGITIPNNASSITVNSQGQVSATVPGNTTPQVLGTLTLTRFVNKAGLQPVGDNLFTETVASGAPQDGQATVDGLGDIQQRNLEQSNVESVTEISDLIAAQRAYEMNAKVITATDQMLQTGTNMLRS
ncbi:Flagellar basal-body rod protein FlgG [Rhodovulum sp. PH10]|uniref:flagellar basal-body rod protein FlgG n=1 Tax=Rhodovulum sp. PH10 TaxID=1187851 RepID=UPI00027C20AF|nr:flagellar basal-body rod protein FlgG [Rhodovulum sp. PH10]EJW09679.1 Flagellar basal-body rod protein FlgG [Rhodovulum sp. PH10]